MHPMMCTNLHVTPHHSNNLPMILSDYPEGQPWMRASKHLIPVTRPQLTFLDLPFTEWVYCTGMTHFSMCTVFLYVGDHCIREHLWLVLVLVIVHTLVCHHEVPPCQLVGCIISMRFSTSGPILFTFTCTGWTNRLVYALLEKPWITNE